MGAGGRIQRAAAVLGTLTLTVAALLFTAARAVASTPLELVRDSVGTTVPLEVAVGHVVYFVLPTSAQQIKPQDVIKYEFVNYQNLQAPVGVNGGAGTPVIAVNGNDITVSGLAVLPGGGVELLDARANNPPASLSNEVVITVTDGNDGTLRHRSTAVPTEVGAAIATTATVENPLAELQISGLTGPNVFVTLTEDSAVLGTTVADGGGNFAFNLTALTPGQHSYRIFSTDAGNRSTSQTALNLFLLGYNRTIVNGILLSPTLQLSSVEIDPGTPLTISGTVKPNAQVNVFLEAPLRSYTATADTAGSWTFTVAGSETAGFTPGQYQAYTIAQDSVGTQSIVSPTATFRVKSADVNNPPPCGDISKGDLNCDGRTNLTDFSILLFHWQSNHRVADINGDSKVNLTDFSIMMFYFAR